MGVYTDLTTDGRAISPLSSRVGLDRSSAQQLLSQASKSDPPSSSAYGPGNEATNIPHQTLAGSGDTYTITFSFIKLLEVADITTGAINYDDATSPIRNAINAAMSAASFPSWTDGDIAVLLAFPSGLSSGFYLLNFTGDSVAGTPCLVTITPTGWVLEDAVSRTDIGHSPRKALEALINLNVISGTPHNVGNSGTNYTKPASNGQTRPRTGLIRDLGLMVIENEGFDTIWAQLVKFYPQIAK